MVEDAEPTSADVLLPCPFCGDREPEIIGERRLVWVACTTGSECLSHGPKHFAEAEAIRAWNTRAALARPDAQEPSEADVERVAQALLTSESNGELSWDKLDLITRGAFKRDARAAIAALRAEKQS